jgi:hypothetical protein
MWMVVANLDFNAGGKPIFILRRIGETSYGFSFLQQALPERFKIRI